MGLYGSIYLLALFLGLVRGHTPLVIGEIMMVSGAAQLLMAPVAALLETRMNAAAAHRHRLCPVRRWACSPTALPRRTAISGACSGRRSCAGWR